MSSLLKRRDSPTKLPKLEINKERISSITDCNPFALPDEFLRLYEVIELIGKGFQAQVFKVKHLGSQKTLAAKIYTTKDEEKVQNIIYEMTILSSLSHPSIISFNSFLSYPSSHTYIILTEYFPGKPLSLPTPSLFSSIIPPLLSVLSYLKEKSVVHWDLNFNNILYDRERNHIMVVDFGVAQLVDKRSEDEIYLPVGNPKFRPPHETKEFNAFEADLWGVWLVAVGIMKGRMIGTKEAGVDGRFIEFWEGSWKEGPLAVLVEQ